MGELARSDLRVGELCARVEVPQNLVSYHLGRLRSAQLVTSRRSAADGRDSYYVLDLGRCGDLLAETAAALHPALRSPLAPSAAVRPHRRTRVLYLCTGNSARSQMAESLTEQLGAGAIEASSAGSHPKPLHPDAVRAMRERGIDIEGRHSKHLTEFIGHRFDYVITLCDRVREVCPEFPDHPELIHWSVPDPAREGANDRDSYPAFVRTADELATRIPILLKQIEHAQEVGLSHVR
jgi:protein-tyrosine-phosphatase/DNA-binding transcriptional ArsR family regulator